MEVRKPRKGLILAIRLFALIGALFVFVPLQVAAADVRAGNGEQTIGAGTTINDDLYIFGNNVNVQGTVDGSVIAAGGTVTIAGHVTHDVMVAGGTVDINGPVDGSVRVAGGNVNVNGAVTGDVVAAGGTLNLGSDATIGRDLLLGAGQATIGGPVVRNVTLGSGTVTIENSVGGNVTGNVDQLTLTSGAKVGGYLDYTSNHSATIDSGATVAGAVTRHTPATTTTPQFGTPAFGALSFIGWLRSWIGISILGLLLVLLFPAFSTKATEALTHRPGASVGFGAAILVVTPIVGIIAFIAGLIIGGWWLAALLLPAYVLALALGYVVSGLLIGRWTAERFGWKLHPAWIVVGGLFVLTAVGSIPVLGWIVSLFAVLFGLGALAIAATTRPPAGQVVTKAAA
jgi:cytoskeletal protein CcmA (bactofilin family)